MKPIHKFGLVALGYLAAFVIASAVTAVRIALTNGPDASAYRGMLAFGDAFLWLNVFGICAAVPTAAALSPLRMLVAPLLALVFLVCALVAPRGYPRVALLSAALMEMIVTGYIALVWFVPMFLDRL